MVRTSGFHSGFSRYDFVLLLIPLLFVGAVTGASVFDMPFRDALALASVMSSVALADVLYLNAPDRRFGHGG